MIFLHGIILLSHYSYPRNDQSNDTRQSIAKPSKLDIRRFPAQHAYIYRPCLCDLGVFRTPSPDTARTRILHSTCGGNGSLPGAVFARIPRRSDLADYSARKLQSCNPADLRSGILR